MITSKNLKQTEKSREDIVAKEFMLSIQKKAESVLKDRYYHLFNLYFESIISGKYDYVVLVTRRAYILFEIFLICMMQHGFTRDMLNVKIITSDSIFLLGLDDCKYKEKRYLILDDIIINGRTIKTVYENLKQKLHVKNIKIASMEYCENAKALDNLNEYLSDDFKVSEQIWKADSNLLTDLIISSNIGYTAFVPSYIFSNVDDNEIESLLEKLETNNTLQKVDSRVLSDCGVQSFFYFWNEKEKLEINIKPEDNIPVCTRLYYNKQDKTFTVIPYVFLDNVLTSECIDYCNYLLRNQGSTLSGCMEQFIKEDENRNEKLALLYKYVISYLCKQSFEKFYENYINSKIAQYIHIKTPYETFDFIGENKWVVNYSGENNYALSKRKFEIVDNEDAIFSYGESKQKFSEIANEIKTSHGSSSNMDKIIYYLNYIKTIDDKNAQDYPESPRCVGIRVKDIVSALLQNDNPDLNTCYELLSIIINLWDEGTAAYNYSVLTSKNDGEIISGLLKNGEQIYNKIYMIYENVYSYFYRLYHKIFHYRFFQINKFAEFMENKTGNSDFTNFYKAIVCGSEKHYFVDLNCISPKQYCHDYDEFFFDYLNKFYK